LAKSDRDDFADLHDLSLAGNFVRAMCGIDSQKMPLADILSRECQ
jgi:hypothetical protein